MADEYELGIPLETRFSELVEAARHGDILAARDVLSQVSTWVTHARLQNERVPPLVLEYLDMALRRMTCGDSQPDGTRKPVSGDDAFYLKAKGKRHWTIDAKKIAAEQVQQILHMGYSPNLDDAAANAAYIIPQIVVRIKTDAEAEVLANAARNNLKLTASVKDRLVSRRLAVNPWHPFFDRTPNEDDLKRWWRVFYGRKIRGRPRKR
ncbi:MAG: hypothetical protein P4M15_06105 [Alphaproteobacteria bacterium]|nr:hypothetical protein [Alphaproteobacteria bacterium]